MSANTSDTHAARNSRSTVLSLAIGTTVLRGRYELVGRKHSVIP